MNDSASRYKSVHTLVMFPQVVELITGPNGFTYTVRDNDSPRQLNNKISDRNTIYDEDDTCLSSKFKTLFESKANDWTRF
jgi:hypothetical protein